MYRSNSMGRDRWIVLTGLLLVLAASGCASTRGMIMTPQGARMLGPADPIAASRPPAITFDPYRGTSVGQPRGLAAFFPSGRPGQSASPSLQPSAPQTSLAAQAMPSDRSLTSSPPENRSELGLRNVVEEDSAEPTPRTAPQPSLAYQARPTRSGDVILPVSVEIETYESLAGPDDPETLLASSTTSSDMAKEEEAWGESVEVPPELPDFRDFGVSTEPAAVTEVEPEQSTPVLPASADRFPLGEPLSTKDRVLARRIRRIRLPKRPDWLPHILTTPEGRPFWSRGREQNDVAERR